MTKVESPMEGRRLVSDSRFVAIPDCQLGIVHRRASKVGINKFENSFLGLVHELPEFGRFLNSA
jgi:hypothetical protein